MLKTFIKKFTPNFVFKIYHKGLAKLASVIAGFPSEKIIVIGVTGTNGKSTTIEMLSKIFEGAGFKVGVSSTIKFKVGKKEWLNNKKMTMPGRFFLQKLLDKMLKAGCKYAIIETTSQGIEQYRHIGINYDVAVFTNLSPEHIEAHKGFENYKNAKGKFFKHLTSMPRKHFGGIRIPKVIVVNGNDEYADYFLSFNADKKYSFGTNVNKLNITLLNATNIILGPEILFEVNSIPIKIPICGMYNLYNAICAITVARHFGISWSSIQQSLSTFKGAEGRFESINEGQDFKIIIDYAHEPNAIKLLYEVVKNMPHLKIIHVFGSCGGGRDIARRPVLGEFIAQNADLGIITNEDPYEDDPVQIMQDIYNGAKKVIGENSNKIKIIPNRREAILFALQNASKNDIVLITGKGSEQSMAVKNGFIAWDDRVVAREELQKLKK